MEEFMNEMKIILDKVVYALTDVSGIQAGSSTVNRTVIIRYGIF
jgi:hypothetical protein